MICCSVECERQHICAQHINSPRETNAIETVENLYWFGSTEISYNLSTGTSKCEEHYWCGPHGDWRIFEPISVELLKKQRDALNETIKELEEKYGNVGNTESVVMQKRR